VKMRKKKHQQRHFSLKKESGYVERMNKGRLKIGCAGVEVRRS
jgi:hypothetical protein